MYTIHNVYCYNFTTDRVLRPDAFGPCRVCFLYYYFHPILPEALPGRTGTAHNNNNLPLSPPEDHQILQTHTHTHIVVEYIQYI